MRAVPRDDCRFPLSILRLRRARVDAYVFSLFYWPVPAADARGCGGEEGRGINPGWWGWNKSRRCSSTFFSSRMRFANLSKGPERGVENDARLSFLEAAAVHLKWLPRRKCFDGQAS